MELLDERWTLLIIRELIAGSERFNDLRRGVPRISPSLLSKRLAELGRAGVVQRHLDGDEVRYRLTSAGEELQPIVVAVGVWGTRWIGELGDADLDPKLLLWDMHRNVNLAALPAGRTAVQFTFPEVPARARNWWLVITPGDIDVCDSDPGYPIAVSVTASLREMTRVWRGDVSWTEAQRSGGVDLAGPTQLRRELPHWFTPSVFAAVPRARSSGSTGPPI
jgi:DNA-binding HxlR family transcriptional regulator